MTRSSHGAPRHSTRAARSKPPVTSVGANWQHASRKSRQQRRGAKKVALASSAHTRKSSGAFPRRARVDRNGNGDAADCGSTSEATIGPTATPELRLDAEIEAFARLVSLTPAERAFRARVFADLKALVCSAFPGVRVQLYGSSSSGLDTFRSDLDISVGGLVVNGSQRAAAHGVKATEANDDDDDESDSEDDELESDDDNDDFEDERRPEQPPVASQPSSADSDDDAPSFSLNIAVPTKPAIAPPVSTGAAAGKSPWNATLRRKKIRELRALQHLLTLARPQFHVKCLHKAKIPILAVVDPTTQLSIDVGVNREAFEASDHGRTTSLVRALQYVLGPRFRVLVAVLKEFLHQFALDKPFTGGLGSFRLYVMVASLFPVEKCTATGAVRVVASRVPSLSALLHAFFRVFGNKRSPRYLQSSTVLRLPLFADSRVDFASVFRLDDCVDAFAMAHEILSETQSLGAIVFEDQVAEQREAGLRAIRAESKASAPGARRSDR